MTGLGRGLCGGAGIGAGGVHVEARYRGESTVCVAALQPNGRGLA